MRERRVLCARLRFENTGKRQRVRACNFKILKLSARFSRFKCFACWHLRETQIAANFSMEKNENENAQRSKESPNVCTRGSKNRKRTFFPYALQCDEKKKTVASLCAQQKKRRKRSLEVPPPREAAMPAPRASRQRGRQMTSWRSCRPPLRRGTRPTPRPRLYQGFGGAAHFFGFGAQHIWSF